jgi:hypothetical protein
MLLFAASLLVASVFASLNLSQTLNDCLVGAGMGTLLSRLVVQKLEKSEGERPGRRIRQIEVAWILSIGCLALALSLALR